MPTLRLGDQSPDGWVEYLQELLEKEGSFASTITGVFDDATLKALTVYVHTFGGGEQ